MKTDPTPYDANLMTKLRFFMNVIANKGMNIINESHCLLNLSKTKWSTSLGAMCYSAPDFDMMK